MEFTKIQSRAMAIRKLFEQLEVKKYGRSWTREEIAMGFTGDVGDLMKLVLSKSSVREIPDAQERLAHELSDCLWSVIVLAKLYGIDLEEAFVTNMHELENWITEKLEK